MTGSEHYSVLLKESVDALVINPNGIYVDGTFGRGGHSREILSQLGERGMLIAFDKDPDAVRAGLELQQEDSRFQIVHESFAALENLTNLAKGVAAPLQKIDGVLLDLGVSSPQLDVAERGFSFLKEGPLDMRMDNSRGQTAAEWINSAEEREIAFVLKEYGEERFSKRMARAVLQERERMPITSTLTLANVIREANPRWEKGKHPATRAFQAIRIYINEELTDLSRVLSAGASLLLPGGRFVVISFHSLEDRIVKRFFRDQSRGKQFPRGVPVTDDMLERTLKVLGRHSKASSGEVQENVRSRSAVIRVAEKL